MPKKRFIIYISIAIAVLLIVGISIFATQQSSSSPNRLLSLGEKYLSELNYEQALVQFLKVIEIEPMNERAYLGAAEAYIGLRQPDKAIEILEQGLTLLPDSTAISIMLGSLSAEPEFIVKPESDLEMNSEVIYKELTMLMRQEIEVMAYGTYGTEDYEEDYTVVVKYNYDEHGNLIFLDDGGDVTTWEFNKTEKEFVEYINGVEERRMGYMTVGNEILSRFIPVGPIISAGGGRAYAYPFHEVVPLSEGNYTEDMFYMGEPLPRNRPQRVDNPESNTNNSRQGWDWIYAMMEYDENGNVVKITSYNGYGVSGHAVLEWATLKVALIV